MDNRDQPPQPVTLANPPPRNRRETSLEEGNAPPSATPPIVSDPQTRRPQVDEAAVEEALARLRQEAANKPSNVPAHKAHQTLATDLFGSGDQDFKLPCGVVINGVVYDHAYIKEMTGREEAFISDVELEATERFERCLGSCITKLVSTQDPRHQITDRETIEACVFGTLKGEGDHPLSASDRIALMLLVRRATVGDSYRYDAKCPNCGHRNKDQVLDLSTVTMNYSPDPTKRQVEVTLPRSGHKAVINVLDGSGEKKAALLAKQVKTDLATLRILARLYSVAGHKMASLTPAVQLEIVTGMGRMDRDFLTQVFNKIEGAVDTDVELDCRKCGRDFSFPLDLGQVFTSTPIKVSDTDMKWV